MDIEKIRGHWYASIYEQQENETNDVELLLSILGNQPKRILEACCGGGRILVSLAKAGHNVVGFDLDDDMMSMIPKKIVGFSNIQFYKADALQDKWGRDYDVVVLAGNIMINIETSGDYKAAQQLFIQKAADALKSGGYIYLDFDLVTHPEIDFSSTDESIYFDGTDVTGVYGRYIGWGGGYDTATQIASGKRRTELTLSTGEQYSFERNSVKHIPSLQNVHDWLKQSGFVIEQEYGDYDKNPISETTYRAIIYAHKVK